MTQIRGTARLTTSAFLGFIFFLRLPGWLRHGISNREAAQGEGTEEVRKSEILKPVLPPGLLLMSKSVFLSQNTHFKGFFFGL